jgi:translation initiation factor IF-3
LEILDRIAAQKFGQVRMVGDGVNELLHILDALRRAEDLGLDLVLVSTDSRPPVVRIQDFKKLEYEKKKARKTSKAVSSALKEIQLKINISEHDLQTKINKVKEFLERGDKVKLSLRLKGREKESPERARQLLEKVGASVDCKATLLPGQVGFMILEPTKTKK